MSRLLTTVSAFTLVIGSSAAADAPSVVADIAPIHSLVAKVMDGIGEPKLIVPNETSPHDYRLRPCLLYTSPSPRDMRRSRMPSSA